MIDERFKLLFKIDSPADLREMDKSQLPEVCKELRDFLIDELSRNPGHFGASLGVVELTVALHYVFDTPSDKLIWDVGHQAYGHKILTGRRNRFCTNRHYKGISGFPNASESIYDSFSTGHSSTSISAALGMAQAAKLKGEKKQIVAIIGDGSMTGGMAFEALNNASIGNPNIIIILNDNNMAIDPNIGGLHNYLVKISASSTYNRLRTHVWDRLERFLNIRKILQKIEHSTKVFFFKESNLFESLNIRYFGPIDGHNVYQLVALLTQLKNIEGPKILHIITKKGKGYTPAEENQTLFHAPGKFNIQTGQQISDSTKNKPPKYQKVFGETLLELAKTNSKIVGITPAMLTGSSMNIMQEVFPDRVFDVGIAEQHAVTFSAGLASAGMFPFCNIYSSFSQRAYDQIIHDVALQNQNVTFCLDRSGLVGADGATHHGAFDLAFLRCIPNLTISAPMNEHDLRNLMYTAQNSPCGPFVIRYPRGYGVMVNWRNKMELVPIGKGRILAEGGEIAVLSIGHMANFVSEAIEDLKKEGKMVAHFNFLFLKPIDKDLLHYIFKNYKKLLTIEDGVLKGGLASEIDEFKSIHNYTAEIRSLGTPDRFIEHGSPEDLYSECGYDKKGIYQTILKLMSESE